MKSLRQSCSHVLTWLGVSLPRFLSGDERCACRYGEACRTGGKCLSAKSPARVVEMIVCSRDDDGAVGRVGGQLDWNAAAACAAFDAPRCLAAVLERSVGGYPGDLRDIFFQEITYISAAYSAACLEVCRAAGGTAHPRCGERAARAGNLAALEVCAEWVPWTGKECSMAARGDSVECLKFLRKNGCHWDEYTPAWASRSGSVGCLWYALVNLCPHDWKATYYAVKYDHVDCLELAVSMGCHFDRNYLFRVACEYCSKGCIRYIIECT